MGRALKETYASRLGPLAMLVDDDNEIVIFETQLNNVETETVKTIQSTMPDENLSIVVTKDETLKEERKVLMCHRLYIPLPHKKAKAVVRLARKV